MTVPAAINLDALIARLNAAPGSAEADRIEAIVEGVLVTIRRMTGMGLEGTPTQYTERVRISSGLGDIVLAHGPILSVQSISRLYWNGQVAFVYGVADWWMTDGRLTLRPFASSSRAWGYDRFMTVGSPTDVQVIYTTTGEIPADVVKAVWRWVEADVQDHGGLVSYTNGADSETYRPFAAPTGVSAVLAGYYRPRTGGVV